MTWIRDHFYEFVFPAMMAAEKRTTELPSPFDIKEWHKAPEDLPTVLKKLWTLCQELKCPWSWDAREISAHGGTSKYRESAKIHHNILRDTLQSALVALKTEKCSKLFLGGRDVWTFAVLCERKGIPYLFVPELSRAVTGVPVIKEFLESRGFTGDELFLDTGFAGSIPRNLSILFKSDFKFRLMSQGDQFLYSTTNPPMGYVLVDCVDPPHKEWVNTKGDKLPFFHEKGGLSRRKRPNQLFPNRKTARQEALETEYLSKYWKTGTYELDLDCTMMSAKELMDLFGDNPHLYSIKGKDLFAVTTDGENFFAVAEKDAYTANFTSWWYSKLTVPSEFFPKMRIVQYLADRASIQRSALLTAQLWYGIPFWKQSAMARAEIQAAAGTGMNQFALVNPAQYNSSITLTAGSGAAVNTATTFPSSVSITTNPMSPTSATVTYSMSDLKQLAYQMAKKKPSWVEQAAWKLHPKGGCIACDTETEDWGFVE